ncbi:pitrilysin family protein [Sphingosinicella sp. LHD-64]|uniref:M16 family metallopeptidase n=1 Tax=Sphingosinicella sp. LHD-64 TaxID=3072139 RepID=UPI00280D47D1|nr:pitrilysin family protein [Sphingosinicella sp. LHD-64]MDQ8756470.1 pitrilysin family protein [Sphingosinicella sp. LHD-64]
MRRFFIALAAILSVAGSTTFAGAAALAQAPAAQAQGADPQALLERVRIPYETFTLANGLRVVVHEDRKAPIVAVSVWYNVGSKDEPAGRTGFAHLFEHIMFNGSENAPGEYFEYTRAIGATDLNGTTWFDRTNYFETVPRPALEQALFLESDRMGHLLGAVTQETLTNQIGVVQNEKRQSDNQPYGLVEYAQLEALFPEGHPYRHSTIGSMADLSAASLATVQDWFRSKYGPNNAVLVLAGDINAAEARPLVERYFGDIARGPVNNPAEAPVPTLPARVDRTMHDRVANTRLYRDWVVPGLTDEDVVPLSVGATILGGLASSRLDNLLVRGEQTAVRVSAEVQPFHRISLFEVQVDVKSGQDAAAVSRRLDEIIAEFVRTGPTEDEVRRTVMRTLSGRIQGLEQVGGFGGKAVALAEGTLYANDPDFYRARLEQLARVTPEQVRVAMQRWLNRPVYALTVAPGEREAYEEAPGVTGGGAAVNTSSQRPRYYTQPQAGDRPLAPAPAATTRREAPGVTGQANLEFPATERATLSNGIHVIYARRNAVPVTRVAVEFDAGIAADPTERQGTQALMLNMLEEGTTSLNSIQLAEAQERLGASVATGASLDRTTVSLTAMSPSIGPSLDLLAQVIRNPAFDPRELERVRQQQLAGIANEMTNPQALAARTLPAVLYGARHPYGKPGTGTGDAAVVQNLTRDELTAFHQRWIRPDNATIFAVSDLPLDRLVPELERRFGNWQPPAAPRGTKTFPGHATTNRPRIVLIDRPQSPQSVILTGQLLAADGTEDLLNLQAANEVLAGNFLARINMDLRETKGWSYGAGGGPNLREHQVPFIIQAPVQADRTGDSIQAIREQVGGFMGANGVQPAELQRVILGNTRQLPGQFETSPAVLNALRTNALYHRPDDYWTTIADRYRGMSQQQLDQTARRYINPDNFVWVVVGDASRVRAQLEQTGLPVEVVPAPASSGGQ